MFDTMTTTKIIGSICGTLLIFLFANMAGNAIYTMGGSGHGEDGHATQAYVIDTGEAHAEVKEDVIEVAFADVLAGADATRGAKVFNKCKACHNTDGSNKNGPFLNNVLDRDIASVDGFAYSGDVAALEGTWTAEALNKFIENPKSVAPGTKMSFPGMKKVTDRANLVAYLATLQ